MEKRDCEEEVGVFLIAFHLWATIFSKELTALHIVTCVFSNSGPNCRVRCPWRVFLMRTWDSTWVTYLWVLHRVPGCLPKWYFWNCTSISAAHGYSMEHWNQYVKLPFPIRNSFCVRQSPCCYSQEYLSRVFADGFLPCTPEDWM